MFRKKMAMILVAVILCMTLAGCDVLSETFSGDSAQAGTASVMDEATWTENMKSKTVDEVDGVEHTEIIEWNDKYLVYAVCPTATGYDGISSDVDAFVQNKVQMFKQEVEQSQETDKNAEKPELSVTCKPYNWKDAVLSFKFLTYANSGVTVTDNYINTYVYNLQTQEKMTLENVFTTDTDYLNRIAELARAQLKTNTVLMENYNETQFMSGTAPNAQNYSTFVVGDGEIDFYFNSMQIASNKAGSFEATLSFDDLKDVLRPEIADPEAAAAASAAAAAAAEAMAALPSYLQYGEGDMQPFSIEGIDPENDKVVALTFDDGPNPSTTGMILDALEECGGKATFFIVGSRVKDFPETVKKVYDSGNEIGNHSYDHKNFTKISTDELMEQINKTNEAIFDVTGARPIIVRPPEGSITDELANTIGRACVLWTVDSEDWKHKDKDVDYQAVMHVVQDGDIVLMHDLYEASANAAVEIIRDLTDEGYKLVTVTQMIQIAEARGVEPEIVVRDLRASDED